MNTQGVLSRAQHIGLRHKPPRWPLRALGARARSSRERELQFVRRLAGFRRGGSDLRATAGMR